MGQIARRSLLLAAVAGGIGTAAAARAAAPVRVGSKLDTEAALLGTIMLMRLNAHQIPTVNRLRLGPTSIVRHALLSGEIDIYPEYTGNGAFFFHQENDAVWKNADEGYARVKQLDAAQNHVAWLTPAPANNTWGIAVRGDVAMANKLRTMEDFARWVSGGGQVKLAGSAEFVGSPAALPAFQTAYDFRLQPSQMLVLAGGDTSATERAAAEGTSGVNAAMAYGTDGAIAALHLVLMEDVKHAQMVYAPCPVIREPVLAAYPAIADLLQPAFRALSGETLRMLNGRVAVDGEAVDKVATEWLASQGLDH